MDIAYGWMKDAIGKDFQDLRHGILFLADESQPLPSREFHFAAQESRLHDTIVMAGGQREPLPDGRRNRNLGKGNRDSGTPLRDPP